MRRADIVDELERAQLVPRSRLLRRVGALSDATLVDACRALRFAVAY